MCVTLQGLKDMLDRDYQRHLESIARRAPFAFEYKEYDHFCSMKFQQVKVDKFADCALLPESYSIAYDLAHAKMMYSMRTMLKYNDRYYDPVLIENIKGTSKIPIKLVFSLVDNSTVLGVARHNTNKNDWTVIPESFIKAPLDSNGVGYFAFWWWTSCIIERNRTAQRLGNEYYGSLLKFLFDGEMNIYYKIVGEMFVCRIQTTIVAGDTVSLYTPNGIPQMPRRADPTHYLQRELPENCMLRGEVQIGGGYSDCRMGDAPDGRSWIVYTNGLSYYMVANDVYDAYLKFVRFFTRLRDRKIYDGTGDQYKEHSFDVIYDRFIPHSRDKETIKVQVVQGPYSTTIRAKEKIKLVERGEMYKGLIPLLKTFPIRYADTFLISKIDLKRDCITDEWHHSKYPVSIRDNGFHNVYLKRGARIEFKPGIKVDYVDALKENYKKYYPEKMKKRLREYTETSVDWGETHKNRLYPQFGDKEYLWPGGLTSQFEHDIGVTQDWRRNCGTQALRQIRIKLGLEESDEEDME